MPESALPALVSVHDVMPATLSRVEGILALLEERAIVPATLLVVPGLDWSRDQLRRLRALEQAGHRLAGHGWVHRAPRVRGIRHRLHSALISRGVAEHLALDAEGIRSLIGDCHRWFADQGLSAPALYVPPAWAMGRILRERLAELPFRFYEVLSGVYDAAERRHRRLPLVGYEAHDAWRAPPLRLWNGISRLRACPRAPLRVAIHPRDLELSLADDLRRLLERPLRPLAYEALA